jgi:asparaginyl-tRNA synthetase
MSRLVPAHSPSAIWQNHDFRHRLCALANPWYQTLACLQNTIAEATVDFWRKRGGQTVFLPLTTGAISSPMGLGSDSSPVEIELFGVKTYLADSMQFMLEYAIRLTGNDCYYVMPSFRGEETDASHLSQFFHSEAEIEGGLSDVQVVIEHYLAALASALTERHADAIIRAGGNIEALVALAEKPAFTRISFDDAAMILGGNGIQHGARWRTLTRAGERRLMERVGQFVWVENWDYLAVPFYQAYADASGDRAKNADLLFGMGEVVGAGERHKTAADVRSAMTRHQVDPSPYEWYCEMRDVTPLQTSGFGMGIERFLMWVLNHNDIRDFQLVPRENGVDFIP